MTEKACSFDGCGRPHQAKGLCQGHRKQQKEGRELSPIRPTRTRRQVEWTETGKICTECRGDKPLDDFHANSACAGGLDPCCKECRGDGYLKRMYGIDRSIFDSILSAQGGGCAICGTSQPGGKGAFHVDHDHSCCPGNKSCGRCIRGLLCYWCNFKIVAAIESDIYVKAIEYLEKHRRIRQEA